MAWRSIIERCCYNASPLEALMRIDLYMKVILTIVAIALVTIACKSVVEPTRVAADGPLAGVQFFGLGSAIWGVDTRTGDVWAYGFDVDAGTAKPPAYAGKITQLGKPLVSK
jgi:hypothetical protein